MPIKLTYIPFKPDIKRFDRAVKSAVKRLWNDAIGEFVTHIVFMDLVKVDTGMSAGSLLGAAAKASLSGAIEQAIIFKRKRAKVKGYTTIGGNYDASRYKTLRAGKALARRSTKVDYNPRNLLFRFTINVFQWELHEEEWNALDQGADAFVKFVDDNVEAYLPGLEELFV